MPELAKLTWPEAATLFEPSTVAILPVGSTEPHGPHLPLDTDVTIAVAMARRAMERLEEQGIRALVLPPLAYGVTNWTSGFKGRVTLKPGTLWALVEDVVASLEQDGLRRIVLANGHLEPAHVEVLRGVVLDHAELGPQRAQVLLADVSRRRFAQTLGDEFASGDCHAGSYETSLVLAADPASVRERELRGLAEVRIDLLAKMKAGITSFAAAGAKDAYCGDPAAASAREGEQAIDRLADVVVVLAREAWPELFARGAQAGAGSEDGPGRSRA